MCTTVTGGACARNAPVTITAQEVTTTISGLDRHRSTGPAGVYVDILVPIGGITAPLLAELFHVSLKLGR